LDGQIPAFVFGFVAKADGFTMPRGLITFWVPCNGACDCHANFHQASAVGVSGTGQLIFLKTTDISYNVMTQQSYLNYAMRAGVWTHFEIHMHSSWLGLWVDGLYIGKFGADVLDYEYLFWDCPPSIIPHFPLWPIKRIQLGGHTSWIRTDSPSIRFDDFYIANYPDDESSDDPPPTPIGDLAVKVYSPVADGTYTDWTPLIATDHHEMVDDRPHDSDGTYVYAEAVSAGDKDSYTFDIVTTAEKPLCVQPVVAMKKTNIGFRQINLFQKLDAVEENNFSGPITIPTPWPPAYHFFPNNLEDWFDFSRDVNGDEWTFANLIDTEFGVEIYV
jgi:hypothetical protein